MRDIQTLGLNNDGESLRKFSRSLPMALLRAREVVMERFRPNLRENSLTDQQWRVMRALWEQEHLTSKKISQITLIPAPSLVGILDRLEKKGLLGRLRSVEDRRLVFIRPTKAGRELQEIMLPKIEEIHNFLIERVTNKEWNEMKRILDKLSGHSSPSAKIFRTGN